MTRCILGIALAIIVSGSWAGWSSRDAAGGTPSAADAFVTAKGASLQYRGSPVTLLGINVWGAASDPALFDCGAQQRDQAAFLDSTFAELSRQGFNTVRFFAFQSYAGGGADFSAIQRVLDAAREHQLWVIPVLGNEYADCDYYPSYAYSAGFMKDSAWYAGGYRQPHSGYARSYRDYVSAAVRAFKDDPSILMWQLMNEAQVSSTTDGSVLREFADDVATMVKSTDPNHLVSLGTRGTGEAGSAGADFSRLHALAGIDVVEAHDYGADRQPLPGYPSCRQDCIWGSLMSARALKKPFIIGESGIVAGDDASCGASRRDRAELFTSKILAMVRNGGAGYLLWSYDGAASGNPCSYNLFRDDPTILRMPSIAAALAIRELFGASSSSRLSQ